MELVYPEIAMKNNQLVVCVQFKIFVDSIGQLQWQMHPLMFCSVCACLNSPWVASVLLIVSLLLQLQ